MNLSINYNGTDITDIIDIQSCILTDRYGGMLDSVRLGINDSNGKWSNYGISKGDEIIIKTDGYTTGAMYVDKPEYRDRLVTIDAVSLRQSKKIVKSKIWRYVKLSEILTDCAKNNNLTLKTYGITDYTYESVAQIHKTDLEFASLVCKREGYSIKVDNNCLIVFNEFSLENATTDLTIRPEDVSNSYNFKHSGNCINSLTVSHYDIEKGLIEQTAFDKDIPGGAEIINERVTSYDEAKRFAYGYLRDRNKKHIIGYLSMPYNPKISAGTLFNAEGFSDYDGKYVVFEVSHNIKNETSSISARKVLSY